MMEILFDDGRAEFSERIEAIDVASLSNDDLRALDREKNRFVHHWRPMGKPPARATQNERCAWDAKHNIYSDRLGRRCQLAVQVVVDEVHRRCTGGLMDWPPMGEE